MRRFKICSFCLHEGWGEEERKSTASSAWLGSEGRKQSDGDGRAQIYTLPHQVHINLLPLWPTFIYSLSYLFICPFIQPAAAAFVCLAATQACTLVNGQHVIGVMERPRNHAQPAHTQSSQSQRRIAPAAPSFVRSAQPLPPGGAAMGFLYYSFSFFYPNGLVRLAEEL